MLGDRRDGAYLCASPSSMSGCSIRMLCRLTAVHGRHDQLWFARNHLQLNLAHMQVAIKKVLQDKRFKNRELQIMKMLGHTNVVQLKHCFYMTSEKNEIFLNLVLEYVPETVYRISKHYAKNGQRMPTLFVKLYVYQMCRSLHHIHAKGVCHRDIKPQNLLVNTSTHQLKLCDFGSAKVSLCHGLAHSLRGCACPLVLSTLVGTRNL